MVKKLLSTLFAVFMLAPEALAWSGSGVYVGGHIRRERPATITTLKNSGFTYVILFNVSVEADGTLTTDGETICKDGEYVFDKTQPHYIGDVKSLKEWPTAIERIEICIGGWGNESYSRIRDLINAHGTVANTVLYRNFKALKDQLPEIDAVNNDDEHCYDVTTAVRFHAMMKQLGYRTTVAPYTNKDYWQSLVSQMNSACPGACDCVMVQCYDGGAGNQPRDWHLEGLPLHAGRTNYQTDMQTSIAQMQTWRDEDNVTGAFVWVYNDETWSLNQWASAMNRVFPTKTTQEPVLWLYSDNNFGGYCVALPEGRYGTGELAAWGISDKDIASFEMKEGYRLTAYTANDLTGTSREWTDTQLARMSAWANRISSLKVEKTEASAVQIPGNSPSAAPAYFDLQGRRLSEKPQRGVFLIRKAGTVRKAISPARPH